MIAVNQGDLLWMRDMQEETMIDECMILTWSTTGKGRYNSSKGEFEDGETFPCGFKPGATREVSDGTQMGREDHPRPGPVPRRGGGGAGRQPGLSPGGVAALPGLPGEPLHPRRRE